MKIGKIEKGVPLNRPTISTTLPFSEMEVGDSFTVEASNGANISSFRSGVSGRASTAGAKLGKKFTVRFDGKKTMRIWRIR